MSYLVIARKWRPMVFEDVVGQEHVTTTLKNAIATNRLAHAYIFSGPRGVGKTTSARILAKAINCENGGPTPTPCNQCVSCQEITSGRSLDVLEIDGASNRGIDEIRNLRDTVRFMPMRGGHKIYIIDEFHMITKDAFNALLKTLEEPPERVIFIFATTEPHKVLPTILSRCQRFDFKRVPTAKMVDRMRYICKEEGITVDDESLFSISQMADGGMRDAMTLLDQVISFCGMNVSVDQVRQALGLINQQMYFELIDVIRQRDVKNMFEFVAKVLDSGWDITEFLHGFLEHLRNVLVAKTCGRQSLTEVFEAYQEKYFQQGRHFSETDLMRMMNLVSDTIQKIKWSVKQKFVFELALMKLLHMDSSVQLGELLQRLDRIENGAKTGSPSVSEPEKKNDKLNENTNIVAATPPVLPVQQKTNHPNSSSEVQKTSIAITDIESRWNEIVSRVKTEKIRVGAILEETFPHDIVNDTLLIGFKNDELHDFHAEIINKEKDYLTQVLQGFIGKKIRVKCDLELTPIDLRIAAPQETQDSLFNHYPTIDGEQAEERLPKISTTVSPEEQSQIFTYLRELEQQNPLKKVIEMLDGELVNVDFKKN
ncbi:DNA polymerase III subunit gamma/tau [bacterium]|nr:DNA polymerase III subunit gamma/tau [bacterium]